MGFLARIHPENPQQKQLESIAKILQDGGVAIIPTDTVYAMACSSASVKGLDKMTKIKGRDFGNAKFSFVFEDLSQLSAYTKQFDTATYKVLKRALPGPYTFIMESSNSLSKLFKNKRHAQMVAGRKGWQFVFAKVGNGRYLFLFCPLWWPLWSIILWLDKKNGVIKMYLFLI